MFIIPHFISHIIFGSLQFPHTFICIQVLVMGRLRPFLWRLFLQETFEKQVAAALGSLLRLMREFSLENT